MHSILNILKFGMKDIVKLDWEQLEKINNLDYLSQVIFTLHEDLNASLDDDKRFQVTIRVNWGASMYEAPISSIPNHIVNIDLNNYIHVKSKMTLEDLETFFATLFLESNK